LDARTPTTAIADGLEPPRRYWAWASILVVLMLAVLDGSIANVALPTIAAEFQASPSVSIWIVNGYQLAIVVSLLPLAALGEIHGYRRVYLAGIAVFTLASLGCMLADSLPALTAARVVQGLGAAGVMSVNTALLRYTVPARKFGSAIGLTQPGLGRFQVAQGTFQRGEALRLVGVRCSQGLHRIVDEGQFDLHLVQPLHDGVAGCVHRATCRLRPRPMP